MTDELHVLNTVSQRLESIGVRFMLTGSFAMAYYATPRMTRDLDIVVALESKDIERLVAAFSPDFYVDVAAATAALKAQSLFNMLHLATGIKVDFIVRKDNEYRQLEFGRRSEVSFGQVSTWITSREDLILSKLIWAKETDSELQRRDVVSLMNGSFDQAYVDHWAQRLDVTAVLHGLKK